MELIINLIITLTYLALGFTAIIIATRASHLFIDVKQFEKEFKDMKKAFELNSKLLHEMYRENKKAQEK